MVLKEIQDPLLLPCDSRIEQKWLKFAGDWPNWLPMVGHTLAMTHVYNLKYTSLRTYWLTNLSCVCPRSSAWSLTLLSLDLDQLYAQRSYLAAPTLLGNDATVNTGRSLAFLFSFSLTSLSLLLPREEQVQHCHHVLYTNKQYSVVVIAGMLVKLFIAVLVLYKNGCASAMGSTLYWVGVDVHGPRYGWSMRQASAMLLVPDINNNCHCFL